PVGGFAGDPQAIWRPLRTRSERRYVLQDDGRSFDGPDASCGERGYVFLGALHERNRAPIWRPGWGILVEGPRCQLDRRTGGGHRRETDLISAALRVPLIRNAIPLGRKRRCA